MHVVVCIVGFRSNHEVVACIAALALSTHTDFEVVVCENGSRACRDELARNLEGALGDGQALEVLPYCGNLGYAGGNNRCIEARPDAAVWWILNPDTEVRPDTMELLLAKLQSGDCDAVGGVLCDRDGRVQAYGGKWNALFARAESIGNGTRYDAESAYGAVSPDYILGASLMFGRNFLSRAGPMRNDYFLYGEEVEWCLRARARDLRLGVEPRAIVYHDQGATTGNRDDFSRRPRLPVYLDQRNKVLILRDTGTSPIWLCALGCLIALILRAGKRGAWRQFGYGFSGWLAGLRNERGVPVWLTDGTRSGR